MRHYFVDKQTPCTEAVVPLGYAIPDLEVLLLDEAGNEVGYDCEGEIVVRSPYLSPGYWRQPELTRAAFIPDPAGGPQRCYRTGDLGLMRPDGCLLYMGRKDAQVKIRGYRIEVAEIELALQQHAAIKEAVVLAREDQPGDVRLVAYMVAASQPLPTVNALQAFLRQRLPDYMVPAAFVYLETLPLTATGKVDRRAVPPPSTTRPPLAQPFEAPRTPVEEQLARLWAEMLGLDSISIHDDFLALGGHSLLAMRIITRVCDTFRVDVSMRSLLASPTVADMATLIVQHMASSVDSPDLHCLLAEVEELSEDAVQAWLHDNQSS
jgi:acyl carrier protein